MLKRLRGVLRYAARCRRANVDDVSADGWCGMLERFEGSGLSTESFCEQEGISLPSLKRWRLKIGQDTSEAVTKRVESASIGRSPRRKRQSLLIWGALRAGSSRLELRLDSAVAWYRSSRVVDVLPGRSAARVSVRSASGYAPLVRWAAGAGAPRARCRPGWTAGCMCSSTAEVHRSACCTSIAADSACGRSDWKRVVSSATGALCAWTGVQQQAHQRYLLRRRD